MRAHTPRTHVHVAGFVPFCRMLSDCKRSVVKACIFKNVHGLDSAWVWLIGVLVANRNARFARFMDVAKHFEDTCTSFQGKTTF